MILYWSVFFSFENFTLLTPFVSTYLSILFCVNSLKKFLIDEPSFVPIIVSKLDL